MASNVAVDVLCEDALQIPVDVLALKYAQALYGVDAVVARKLTASGRRILFPKPWRFSLEQGAPDVAASQILFVGVPPLREFGYRDIRTFARTALSSLVGDAPGTKHLGLTVHGPGYGLDEIEAFEAEIAGLVDAVRAGDTPEALRRITVVEQNEGRARRLKVLLADLLPGGTIEIVRGRLAQEGEERTERLRAAGYASEAKVHVFVAMPFKEEMDDVYHYGIQGAVRSAGFLCERADLSSFTGDVLEWVRARIKRAALVIADLTEANPNVYLEVGFAWGCGVPTILLTRDTQQLPFDVRSQRCLPYKKIQDVEKLLGKELRALGLGDDRTPDVRKGP